MNASADRGGNALPSVDAALVFELREDAIASRLAMTSFKPRRKTMKTRALPLSSRRWNFAERVIHAEISGKEVAFVCSRSGADFEDNIFLSFGSLGRQQRPSTLLHDGGRRAAQLVQLCLSKARISGSFIGGESPLLSASRASDLVLP